LIQEEIKRRLNSGNACCHSIPKLFSSSLLSKHVRIEIYLNIILAVILNVREIWSLILREEHRLRVFESRVLRIIFGPNSSEVKGRWRKLQNVKLRDLSTYN
jgi:hypothetical protein